MNELDQLGARWAKELRTRIIGNQQLGLVQMGRARALVGMTERLRSLSPGYVEKREHYTDGTRIRVFHTGREWIAEIDVTETHTSRQDVGELWIPTGLVFTPANDSARSGYGIPVDDTVDNPFDPGVDSDAWTADGALAQVLLTDQPNAGYPAAPSTIPLYFDDYERPTLDVQLRHRDWAIFKPRFRNLGAGFMAVLDEINGHRDAQEPLCPPLFGFTDIAAEYSRLARRFGADPANWPIGSRDVNRQVEKDGHVAIDVAGNVRGIVGIGTVDPSASPATIADELEGSLPALTDGTLKKGSSFSMVGSGQVFLALLDHNDQWIKCGNIDWRSIHPELPSLSWFGSRGRSIPSWELGCGMATFTTYNGTISPGVSFKSYRLDQSITTFNGKSLPQFTPFIFSQGRYLGVLPDDGYVLGAGIQKIDPTDDDPRTRYVLFAVAWHAADQRYQSGDVNASSPEALYWDTTSNVRVWKAEVELRNGVLSPDYYINGIKSDDNPNGWESLPGYRLSTAVTPAFSHWLGDFPEQGDYDDDEFKAAKAYWQTWMFNGSGTEAMCIRSTVYVQRTNVGSSALVQTGCAYPSHALRMTFTENATTIGSYLEISNTIDLGDRVPIAMDYIGDDLVVGYFGGPVGSETGGQLRIEGTNGAAMVEWTHGGDASMCLAYDARYDAAIINTITLSGGFVGTNFLRVYVRGSLEGASGWPGQAGYPVGYVGWGVNFNIAYGPQWLTPAGHPDTIPALAVNDSQFVAGLWHGSAPGSPHGAAPFTAALDFHTLAREFRSSFDQLAESIGVENGWLNFAGALG